MRRSNRALYTALVAALASAAEAAELVTYSYDALGRLTATSTASGAPANSVVATSVHYDAAGNRSAYTVTGAGPAPSPAPPPTIAPPPAPERIRAPAPTAGSGGVAR